MWDFLGHYGLFLLRTITIVIAIFVLFAGILGLAAKNKFKPKEKLSIRHLNDKYKDMQIALNRETLSKSGFKEFSKKQEKIEKESQKKNKKDQQKRIFVLNFEGDVQASQVETLREAITAILTVATPRDEILLRLESPGGVVHGYGLAASQLQRIRERKIPLLVAVDKVAASGGYMMACVADKILAAPFAVIGSIGVLAELPNFHRWLKKHDIDFEQITAGDYKRTISMFGQNTAKGRKKLQEEIEEAHHLFKNFVAANRPNVAINKISTGEHWYGAKALQLKLVDTLMTSDDYLMLASDKAQIYEINYIIRKNLTDKYAAFLEKARAKLFA
jgi:serine protease SohB